MTGAAGFVGRNLVENLKNIRDGKNRTRPNIVIEEIFEYDLSSGPDKLDKYTAGTDSPIDAKKLLSSGLAV